MVDDHTIHDCASHQLESMFYNQIREASIGTKLHRNIKDEKTNYGPDYMDVLMGTKQDNSTFEDMRWSIMNSLAATMIVMGVYTINIL